jgi:two-component system CheB/CheR fusion protein
MNIPADLDVCVVDPDPALYNALAPMFRAAEARLRAFSRAEELLASEVSGSVRCVVAAALLPGMSGVELIGRLRRAGNPAPVVLLVPPDDVGTAVSAMRSGAVDVLEMPAPVSRLLHSLVASSSATLSRQVAAPLGPDGA